MLPEWLPLGPGHTHFCWKVHVPNGRVKIRDILCSSHDAPHHCELTSNWRKAPEQTKEHRRQSGGYPAAPRSLTSFSLTKSGTWARALSVTISWAAGAGEDLDTLTVFDWMRSYSASWSLTWWLFIFRELSRKTIREYLKEGKDCYMFKRHSIRAKTLLVTGLL